jgi:RNA polymerase sigma factor (sigma-70 family)
MRSGEVTEACRRGLLRAARDGDRSARDRLLELELPLVHRVAVRYRGVGLPFDDLAQEGALGLLDAIEHFDESRGLDFEAYARFRIHRAIRNALTERARLLRLPKHVVERRRLLARETSRLVATTGREPSAEELAARTGLPLSAVLEARAVPLEPTSLDVPALPDGSPLECLVADPTAADPEQTALTHDEAERVDAVVARLPSRQRYAVEHAFGFDTSPESIATVAGRLHLSPPRTRTIMLTALAKIRDELERVALLLLF